MCSVFFGTQSNRRDPFIDQSRVLSSAEVPFVVDPARERVVVNTATTTFEPREQARLVSAVISNWTSRPVFC
mgnify:CR=1 FL=1